MEPADFEHACRMPERACEFFARFSRFEYALKNSGYFKGSSDGLIPDWNRFSNELGNELFRYIEENKIAETILSDPPRRQIVKDGKLSWASCEAVRDIVGLFLAIRCIRNNLFHGGKYGDPD